MKNESFKIVIIGSGNVATQLSLALKKAKHIIIQVYSKNKSNADALAKKLNCSSTNILSKLIDSADIYIIAIKDDAIHDISKKIKLNNKIVVHTSGSIELNALKNTSTNIGVFYPLQTISKEQHIDFTKVPICLEANNNNTINKLKKIAQSISKNVHKIDSEQRKHIHLAAVFACNFSNHLYVIAEMLLKSKKLPLNLLHTLIEETALKIKNSSPSKNQTGPAIRGDKKVMQQHIKLLNNNKKLITLYRLMSKQIAQK